MKTKTKTKIPKVFLRKILEMEIEAFDLEF